MNGKKVLIIGSALTAGFISAMATGSAFAQTSSNHSASICKNWNAGEAVLIDYYNSAVRSYSEYSTSVICPLVRATTRREGAEVYVEVNHPYGYESTSCTLSSYSGRGLPLGSNSQTFNGSGMGRIVLKLGRGQSAPGSTYNVLCSIPGNSGGEINAVNLIEK